MAAKRIALSTKPSGDPRAEAWIRRRTEHATSAAPAKGDLYTARLTIDVTPEMRGRLKVAAFEKGITLTELVRSLLEREFSIETTGNSP